MPTYDYVCAACDHTFELFQSMSAPVKKKCPKCGQLKLQRQIGTGAGVIFKGSGFYETDYRSESYRKAAEADKPEKSDGSKSDNASGESSKKKSDSDTSTGANPATSSGSSSSKSTSSSAGDQSA